MTSGYSADAAQDALRHLRHGRAVLVGDEAQVPLHRAHAELSHPEVAQPREDLLVEALAVCLQRRRTEVSEAGEPRFRQNVHSRVRSDVPVDIEVFSPEIRTPLKAAVDAAVQACRRSE